MERCRTGARAGVGVTYRCRCRCRYCSSGLKCDHRLKNFSCLICSRRPTSDWSFTRHITRIASISLRVSKFSLTGHNSYNYIRGDQQHPWSIFQNCSFPFPSISKESVPDVYKEQLRIHICMIITIHFVYVMKAGDILV